MCPSAHRFAWDNVKVVELIRERAQRVFVLAAQIVDVTTPKIWHRRLLWAFQREGIDHEDSTLFLEVTLTAEKQEMIMKQIKQNRLRGRVSEISGRLKFPNVQNSGLA